MDRTARSVGRLHLRADSESAVRRALPRLEDAFRTATLPDAGARLVFVRRLDLGRLPGGASTQSLSLLIESRVTGANWRLVHAGEPESNGAHAVWFRDPLEAHELAALHAAAGRPLDAWFWPIAVPALTGTTSTGDRLRALALSLAALEEAPAALPAWVTSLVHAGHGERLVAALRPGDGAALLRAAGRGEPDTGERRARADTSRAAFAARAPAAFAQRAWSLEPGEPRREVTGAGHDDRHACVERLSRRRVGRPVVRGATPAAGGHAAGRTSARTHAGRPPAEYQDARSGESPAAAAVTHATAGPASPLGAVVNWPASAAPQYSHQRPRPEPDTAVRPIHEARQAPASSWAAAGDAEPTAAGGLLFLVPVLERLGFGQWAADCDPAQQQAPGVLARQIFHILLSRLRITDGDPAWLLAVPCDDDGDTPPNAAVRDSILHRLDEHAPAIVAQGRRSRMRGLRIPSSAAIPGLWLAACRVLLRRQARIGLASLVVRPGWLGLTRTHADVFFALNAADVRVRRAGLDTDPGWVPWLGQVVAFHFGDSPWT